MDEEDGRLGPQPGHIIDEGSYRARYAAQQQVGAQIPGRLKSLNDVTGSRAQKFGRIDVLRDALMMSLCHAPKHFHRVQPISESNSGPKVRAFKDPNKSEVMP